MAISQNHLNKNRDADPKKVYLLFDAGGTVVFPNQDLIIRKASDNAIPLTAWQLYEGYYHLIHQLDANAAVQGSFPDNPWPRGYTYALFQTLGLLAEEIEPLKREKVEALAREIETQHRQERSLWTFTFPWVEETLAKLEKLGYRMSILTNSDGRAKKLLRELELDRFFEKIFDSSDLKIEKPDPAIFKHALTELKLNPEEVIYIGDIHEVDIKGAEQAGLCSIHIDPLRICKQGHTSAHLQDLRRLPEYLNNPQEEKHPKKFANNLSSRQPQSDLQPFLVPHSF